MTKGNKSMITGSDLLPLAINAGAPRPGGREQKALRRPSVPFSSPSLSGRIPGSIVTLSVATLAALLSMFDCSTEKRTLSA